MVDDVVEQAPGRFGRGQNGQAAVGKARGARRQTGAGAACAAERKVSEARASAVLKPLANFASPWTADRQQAGGRQRRRGRQVRVPPFRVHHRELTVR